MFPSSSNIPVSCTASAGATDAPTNNTAVANATTTETTRATRLSCRNATKDRIRFRTVDPVRAVNEFIGGAPNCDDDPAAGHAPGPAESIPPRPARPLTKSRIPLPPSEFTLLYETATPSGTPRQRPNRPAAG